MNDTLQTGADVTALAPRISSGRQRTVRWRVYSSDQRIGDRYLCVAQATSEKHALRIARAHGLPLSRTARAVREIIAIPLVAMKQAEAANDMESFAQAAEQYGEACGAEAICTWVGHFGGAPSQSTVAVEEVDPETYEIGYEEDDGSFTPGPLSLCMPAAPAVVINGDDC